MPDPDFIGLIQSVTASAEAAMGQLNVLTGRLARDGLMDDITKRRALAERSLRLLESLASKTRGNLDREEAMILTNGIGSLRELLASSEARAVANSSSRDLT
jgi:Domain of unknown function (DUF1844)